MLKKKIEETKNEIATITSQLVKMATSAPTPVLRLKAKDTSRRDTSSFTVIDNAARASKEKSTNSAQFMSSIGSVMDSLKSGKNHSYDEVEAPKPVPMETPVVMNPVSNKHRRPVKEAEPVTVTENMVFEKPRDMSEYTVPKDMSVAINKDALNEVVQEMGSAQPKFLRQMIDELQKK